jgi:hypothetical protein
MPIRKLVLPIAGALILFLSGCSETPQTVAKKEPEKPLEPVGGQSALYKMYQAGRSWAPDLQVLKASSMYLEEVPDVPRGKAAAWEATFVSATKNQAKSMTYSVKELLPNLRKGVFGAPEHSWSGPSGNTTPFPIIGVKVDTDAAYETALKNGGADYDKKNPGKRIVLVLERINKFPDPAWRVVWGDSVGTSNFSVYVDAVTGDFLEKVH